MNLLMNAPVGVPRARRLWIGLLLLALLFVLVLALTF
jgi:hypothetical protein